jgi:hypothetical protein
MNVGRQALLKVVVELINQRRFYSIPRRDNCSWVKQNTHETAFTEKRKASPKVVTFVALGCSPGAAKKPSLSKI